MRSLCKPLPTVTRHLRTPSRPRLLQPSSTQAIRLLHRTFTTTANRLTGGPLLPPLNLPKWLSENAHLLEPPINNYCVYHSPLTVMVVGGPNARTDYHINSTPEFFYQYKGRMLLKTIQTIDGKETFEDVYINEGELFLLPGNTPHNPVRFADTVGIVIEQPRPAGSVDLLRWYCRNCGEKVHEASFHCTDLGSQIKDAVQEFGKRDIDERRCRKCREICQTRPTEEEMEGMR